MTDTTLFLSIALLATIQCAGICGLVGAFVLKTGPTGYPGPCGAMGESCDCPHCRAKRNEIPEEEDGNI